MWKVKAADGCSEEGGSRGSSTSLGQVWPVGASTYIRKCSGDWERMEELGEK